MGTVLNKPRIRRDSAEKRAAREAELLAKNLHSFAASLLLLNPSKTSAVEKPTPRNWWRVQAGRFKDDPTFPAFVAQIQAARQREG